MRVDRRVDVWHVPRPRYCQSASATTPAARRAAKTSAVLPRRASAYARRRCEEEQRVRGVERDREAGEQAADRRVTVVRRCRARRPRSTRPRARRPFPEALPAPVSPSPCGRSVALERGPVAAARDRDRDVGDEDPARGAEVAEPAPADAARDAVDRRDHERQDDERLEQDEHRQRVEVVRSPDAAERRQQQRPAEADERRRQVPVRERPCRRPEVRSGAVLREEPAVVLDPPRQEQQQQPLQERRAARARSTVGARGRTLGGVGASRGFSPNARA